MLGLAVPCCHTAFCWQNFSPWCVCYCLLWCWNSPCQYISWRKAEITQQTQTQGNQTGPSKSGEILAVLHWPSPPPTIHIHTAALHNRVTEEIKRRVLLRRCAWLCSVTYILSSNNEVLLCQAAQWPHAAMSAVFFPKMLGSTFCLMRCVYQ